MMALRTPVTILMLVLTLLLSTCGGAAELDANPVPPGTLGIVQQNGVECLADLAAPHPGELLYAAPDGDARNRGDRPQAPLPLAEALCSLRPGQTLLLLPGTYRQSILLGEYGTPGLPIVIRGLLDGDQRPRLDGEGMRSVGIGLVESTNLVIENLSFVNYRDQGLLILLGSQFVVRGNLIENNGRDSIDPDANGEGFGINVLGARQVLIENNLVLGNGPNHQRWEKHILGTGINTYELVEGVIRQNQIVGNIGGGILVENGAEVLVENNHIEGNQLDANGDYWDGGIWVDGSRQVVLRGNTIINNLGPGIVISDEDVRYPAASIGTRLEGNIVRHNLYGLYSWNFGVCPLPEDALLLAGNEIRDNDERDFWCERWSCGERQACGD